MLTKGTEYAIRALVYIQLQSWKDKRPGIVEIAKEIEAPEQYCAKILQTLARHKLVKSMKGRGGGFFFDEANEEITPYDVIHVMEGDDIFNKCGFGLKNCNNDNPCPVHNKYVKVRDAFYDIVVSETIQSLSEKIINGKAVLKRLTV